MNLERKAIERIKLASEIAIGKYNHPLVCTYSGGKDSDVLLELIKRSGVPFTVHHSHTTVDAPPTVYHIRNKFKHLELEGIKCNIEMPLYQGKRITMWELIPIKKLPPTRLTRYCCAVLKETGCKNRFIATGVRHSESIKRRDRTEFEAITSKQKDKILLTDELMLMNDNDLKREWMEHCQRKEKSAVNPIINWTDRDIWNFIESEKIKTNPLYQIGYYRVGCIGCPMVGKSRYKEFADFPQYKSAFIRAFDKMLEELKKQWTKKPPRWKTGEEVFCWWMEDKNIEGQMNLIEDGFI